MRMCEFQLPVGMHLFYKFPTALDLLKCSKPCSLVFHPLLPTLKKKKKTVKTVKTCSQGPSSSQPQMTLAEWGGNCRNLHLASKLKEKF